MALPASPITINGMPWEVYRKTVLDEMFRIGAESVDDSIIKLAYNPGNVKTKDVKMKSWAGLSPAQSWDPNGSSLPKTVPNPRYDISWTNLWYGNSVQYTLEHKQFNLYPEMNNMSQELAETAKTSKVLLAVSLFNTGMDAANYPYADGKAFFAADHPLDPRAVGSLTYSNLTTGDLAVGSLKTAIALLGKTPNDMGLPMGLKPKYLWVHPDNYFNALEVVNQGIQYQSGDSKFTKNVFNDVNLTVKQCPWFTNTKFWMLQGDKIGTVWNDVVDLASGFKEDDGDTFITTQWVYYCCSRGLKDPRGFVASAGS